MDSQPATARPAVLLGVLVCAVSATAALRGLRTPPLDLTVFQAGGRAVLGGHPLYNGPVALGLDFTYPPLAAVLFAPLALLPLTVAHLLMTIANLGALGLAVWLSRTALDVPGGRELAGLVPLATGVLFWVEAVRTTVYLGQVNLILLILVLWDVLRPDGRHGKGIAIGLAAGIKLTPLIFLPFLLLTRRFRAAATAVASFLGTIAVGFAVLPGDSAKYWLTGVFADSRRVFPNPSSPHNQSLRGMLARLLGFDAMPVWWALAAAAAAAGLGLAAWANRHREELLGVTLCGLTGAAVSPHAWGHHWVWLVPLTVFIAHRALSRAPGRAFWLLPALLLPLCLPWLVNLANPPTGSPVLTAGPAAFLLGNIYVLVFVAALAASGGYLRASGADHVLRRPAPSMLGQP